MRISILFIVFFVLTPLTANAYVGPGLGLGVIGVILGILASIFLAVIGIFWYPLKRAWQKIRKMKKERHD